ncbi:MAG: DUF1292 domain-containing protein [Tissierellia bacterium]|nr:DUF1292 domain-containing protein [Tissierellia bacterium]
MSEERHGCGCGCDHHGEEHDGEITEMLDKITLTLDDDTQIDCGILGIFEVEEQERDYIALVTDGGEVYLYRYIPVEEEDQLELDAIATDDEYNQVKATFENLFLEGEDIDIREE